MANKIPREKAERYIRHLMDKGFSEDEAVDVFQKETGDVYNIDFLEAAKNIPESFANEIGGMLSGVGSLIAHPIDTLGNMSWDAIKQDFADAYGDGNWRRTIQENPARPILDLSTLLTGVGGVGRGAAKAMGTSGKIAKAIETAGGMVDPLNLLVTKPAYAFKNRADSLGKKIDTVKSRHGNVLGLADEGNLGANTFALEQGITADAAGRAKLADMQNALGVDRDALLAGHTVDTSSIADVLRDIPTQPNLFGNLPNGKKATLKAQVNTILSGMGGKYVRSTGDWVMPQFNAQQLQKRIEQSRLERGDRYNGKIEPALSKKGVQQAFEKEAGNLLEDAVTGYKDIQKDFARTYKLDNALEKAIIGEQIGKKFDLTSDSALRAAARSVPFLRGVEKAIANKYFIKSASDASKKLQGKYKTLTDRKAGKLGPLEQSLTGGYRNVAGTPFSYLFNYGQDRGEPEYPWWLD